MSEPIQFSVEPPATDESVLLYETDAALSTTQAALVQPSLVTPPVAVDDEVTLSPEAIDSSSSANLLAFTGINEESLMAQVEAQAAFRSEFPLEHLLDEGYTLAEVAAYFDLPTGALDANPEIHTFDTAA